MEHKVISLPVECYSLFDYSSDGSSYQSEQITQILDAEPIMIDSDSELPNSLDDIMSSMDDRVVNHII